MRAPHPHALLTLLALVAACTVPPAANAVGDTRVQSEHTTLATPGWLSLELAQLPAPLRRVEAMDVFTDHAGSELIALDEAGRCWILARNEAEWVARVAVDAAAPFAALASGAADSRVEGPATFVGGDSGALYAISSRSGRALETRLMANEPGRPITAVLCADLDPFTAGPEVLAFTETDAQRLSPTAEHGAWGATPVVGLPRGVRDAVALPLEVGKLPLFATVSRAGRVELSSLTPDGPLTELLHVEDAPAERVALAPRRPGSKGPVLYTTYDDGRLRRHARSPSALDGPDWITSELPASMRHSPGLAAGRFHESIRTETVAAFDPRGALVLYSRESNGWYAFARFDDVSGATWITSAELDGRNRTDEILICDGSGRIVALSRAAGGGDGLGL